MTPRNVYMDSKTTLFLPSFIIIKPLESCMTSFAGVSRAFCSRCTRSNRVAKPTYLQSRGFAQTRSLPLAISHALHERRLASQAKDDGEEEKSEEGAMSRRLTELSETNLEEGGRSAQRAVEEAGFDEELKQRLLAKIEDTKFRHENRAAFTEAELNPSLGPGSRANALATPWQGTESTEDTSLRMLNDAYKPIKRPSKIPAPRGAPRNIPKKVDVGRPRKAPSTGVRLATAKDRSTIYASIKENYGTDKEKEERLKVMKERFTSGARPMPVSIQGLAALANERIEDAIARGQFKNLPRGKKIERDHNASSPFLDTTEYFMNKIIKKQDIVPPWIEKQQELVSAANTFRSRLRADWRRHAARLIASKGGSVDEQVRRAEQYAAAEAIVNPPLKKEEKLTTVNRDGRLSQITLTGDLEKDDDGKVDDPTTTVTVTEEIVKHLEANLDLQDTVPEQPVEATEAIASNPNVRGGAVFTFRDPQWERAERSYHNVVIENLNSLTRSYNLMAPNLARKPYFSLDREMRACYADVAPLLPSEIRERAKNPPKIKIDIFQDREGGVLENLGGGPARVYDERRPRYGFREFWKDLFAKESA